VREWPEIDWEEGGKLYSAIEDSRFRSVDPWFRIGIENSRAKTILDYGGGDGRLLHSVRTFTEDAWYYDPSPSMRMLAKDVLQNDDVRICSSPTEIPSSLFDVIVFSAVWMTLSSEEECISTLSKLKTCLTPSGCVLFSVTHPCFRTFPFSTFSTAFDADRYLESGHTYRVFLSDNKSGVVLHDHHWPLAAMARQIAAAELYIDTLDELVDIAPDGSVTHCAPAWLVGSLRVR
jgi:methyltransferase family protein